jgi:hypothetical protein
MLSATTRESKSQLNALSPRMTVAHNIFRLRHTHAVNSKLRIEEI